MADIIDLEKRKAIRRELSQADKLEGLQSLLRCGRCASRCAKCGAHGLPTNHVTHPGTGVSFRLCPDCLDDYSDVMRYLEGNGRYDGPSWHNREWVRLWLTWLDYQWALNNYLSSPEVLSILAELEDR